jgi:hypothetical protein
MAEVVDRARAASRAHRFGGVTVAMVVGSIVMGDSSVADRMRATAGSVDLPMAVAQALGDPALSIMVGLMVDPAGTRSAIGAVALRIGGWTVAAAGVAVAAVPLLGIGLVFFAGGATNLVYPFATLWELREAVDRVDPARLVLLITTGVADYDKTRELAAELFRVPLPVPVVVSAGYHTTIRGAILFADDWTPSIVPFAQPGTAPRMPVEWGCVQALRPTFERIGARWPGHHWRYRLRGYLQYAAVVGLLAATLLALVIAVLITSAP